MEIDMEPTLEAVADDPVLRTLVSMMIRRRAAGYTPVLIVSVGENEEVISDTLIEPDEYEGFLEYLWTSGASPRSEAEDQ